jgi:hypothetical protein
LLKRNVEPIFQIILLNKKQKNQFVEIVQTNMEIKINENLVQYSH